MLELLKDSCQVEYTIMFHLTTSEICDHETYRTWINSMCHTKHIFCNSYSVSENVFKSALKISTIMNHVDLNSFPIYNPYDFILFM